MSLLDQSDRLKNICNVVKPTDFSFEGFVIDGLIVCYLTSCLFERDDLFPANKQMNELLAEISKRLDFLVLGLSLSLLAHETVLIVRRYFNKFVFGKLLV